MDWFLYDNGLRHERINLLTNFTRFSTVWRGKWWASRDRKMTPFRSPLKNEVPFEEMIPEKQM